MPAKRPLARLLTAPVAAIALLAACASVFDEPLAHAAPPTTWPPVWLDAQVPADDGVPRFEAPSAAHCRRGVTTREVPGASSPAVGLAARGDAVEAPALAEATRDAGGRRADKEERMRSAAPAAKVAGSTGIAPAAPAGAARDVATSAPLAQPPAPVTSPRPADETVTAGMVDDNTDFGEYLAYRQRNAGLQVHERDIAERYLLEVTDAAGRPVHDAEVAVQRPGQAEPVMWARTDTAGRVWVHPRIFLPAGRSSDRALGVAVRKGAMQARGVLVRGQASSVQVRLGGSSAVQRPRLDLVFLVDATGSMGDEIAKLKASMRAMSQQISQLPGTPDICYGLVAYRDRGDAFITRTHDLTDDLGAFQQMLARVQAGGGGDKPEALNEAWHEVVHGLTWRTDAARLVVLVADAPPHLDYEGPQYHVDMQAALAKGIKLFAVGASGLDPVGEYIYRQIAQYTAGRFVFLTYKDADDPASGPGTQTPHDVHNYSVQTLDRLIVRLVSQELVHIVRS